MDYCVPLLEIYPVEGQDNVVFNIAKALEIVRYVFLRLNYECLTFLIYVSYNIKMMLI